VENRPKSENWATLTPRSSATVRHTEKLTDLGNSLALGLQRGVNSISLQCIPWPVVCSEWGACLTDFANNWPLKWKFSKMSFRIPRRDTEIHFVTKCGKNRPLRSCRKVAWFTKHKKLVLRRTRPSPRVAQNGPIAPKIPWTLSSLDISTYTKFGPDQLRSAALFRKDWFFGPKSQYNIGFQPTNIRIQGSQKVTHFAL